MLVAEEIKKEVIKSSQTVEVFFRETAHIEAAIRTFDNYKVELYNCHMYIRRLLAPVLKECIKQFPAVLVTGPRQSGKTTFLLHELGKNYKYVSFDDPIERGFAVADPNGFLDRFGDTPVILDEIQHTPEILPYLKIRIDKDRKRAGKWILTGSQQ